MKGLITFMGQKSRFNVTIQSFHKGVTGSCTLVSVNFPNGETNRFLVDCGLFQEKNFLVQNEIVPIIPEKVDFVLITHNHTDHTGRLPLLVKNGLKAPIYSNKTNCLLMPPALKDSSKVLKNFAKIHNKKALYSDSDVEGTLELLHGCNWDQPEYFNSNIKFTFFKNGHLVGASIILVQISFKGYEDINLLFTGDYSNQNIFFYVPVLPDWVLSLPLTVVCESTYGNTNSANIEYCFNHNLIEAVKKDYTVICPVFSQGRAQEVLYQLKVLQEAQTLNTEIPIFLDGNLAIKYTEKYKKCSDIRPDMRDFFPENFSYVDTDLREALLSNTASKIILCSSGMGSYGPAQSYIPEYITRKNALIHFTGYCAEDTLGRKLKDAHTNEMVNVGGRILKKLATVEYTSEFSAHAKADELIAFLNQFTDLRMVLINHGEPDVKEQFAKEVVKSVSTKNVGILGADYSFRVDRYGFVKSLPM